MTVPIISIIIIIIMINILSSTIITIIGGRRAGLLAPHGVEAGQASFGLRRGVVLGFGTFRELHQLARQTCDVFVCNVEVFLCDICYAPQNGFSVARL